MLENAAENIVLRYAALALVIAMIWFILYKIVYPFFLRYYHPDFCKTIFWNLFWLYSLTWGFVALYLLLDVGFHISWLPWTAVFLAAWWLISGIVLLLRRTA